MNRLELACVLRCATPLMLAVGLGACPSSTQVTPPTQSKPPAGTTFIGGTFGAACTGDYYSPAGVGWAFCDEADEWAYTTYDPSANGYTELPAAIPPSQSGGQTPIGGGFGQH